MVIVNIINSILEAMVQDENCPLQSWQYNDLGTANVRLDSKKPSPTAVFLQISDWTLAPNAINIKESAQINISFLEKESKLDAGGLEQDEIIDRMKALAVNFYLRLRNVKKLQIEEDEVVFKSVYLRSDSNRSGVNLQLTVRERQGECICDGTYNPVFTVTENGTYDVAGYTQVVVQLPDCPECPDPSVFDYICFTAVEAGTKIGMKHYGTNKTTTTPNIYWTTDLENRYNWDFSDITLENIGDKVYLYGYNLSGIGKSASNYSKFTINGKASVGGDITKLLYPEGLVSLYDIPYAFCSLFNGCAGLTNATELKMQATTLSYYCYSYMFDGCTSLTEAPALPTMTLASNCYYRMFRNCTSLTEAPALPATTLATSCYSYMFSGCTSLTESPALPAATLANHCYNGMFSGCTALTKAPALPATTLVFSCYDYMFNNCTALTTSPALPATTLATSCYSFMFNNCTSLTEIPELPANTLQPQCYDGMFQGCTSLTSAELSATPLANGCFWRMFKDCTSLNSIKLLFDDWLPENAPDWVENVSPTGTFYKPSTMYNIPSGDNGIPEGWTVVDYQG